MKTEAMMENEHTMNTKEGQNMTETHNDMMNEPNTASDRGVSFDTSLLEGYVYKEPKGLNNIFEVVATMTATLDFYWLRDMENPYTLFLMITKLPQAHWNAIARCVYLPGEAGLCLADVNCESLTLMQVVEVIRVFCEGLGNTALPSMYSHFLGKDGLQVKGIANLYQDLQQAQLLSQNGGPVTELSKMGLGGLLTLAMAGTRGKEA